MEEVVPLPKISPIMELFGNRRGNTEFLKVLRPIESERVPPHST